jgi:hypothetical protein
VRRLPHDVREFYRVDWEGNLLAALTDSTERYPVTRFFKSLRFGWSLYFGVRRINAELAPRETLRVRVWRELRFMIVGDPDGLELSPLLVTAAAIHAQATAFLDLAQYLEPEELEATADLLMAEAIAVVRAMRSGR